MAGEFFYVLDERVDLLVVDDDPIAREFASVYLSSPSAEVFTASGGNEALEALGVKTFDMLLLDLDMPGVDGFEVLGRVRAESKTARLPVIVVTGREDIAAIDRAYALGATSFVNKPVNWRLLAYQIKFLLRASRATATDTAGV